MEIMFKPRGLTIYAKGRPMKRVLSARFKTTGRTGSRARFLFSRLSNVRRQSVLHDWMHGRHAEMTFGDSQ